MGGGLESSCVGRVYGADGAVRLARHHQHNQHCNISETRQGLNDWGPMK